MQLELKRIQADFGITFIVVTHDQEEALVMADRIAILKDGALLQVGTPHDIYEHPTSRFAADFIGVMNFFPVHSDGTILRADDGTQIAAPIPPGLTGAAIAAIRPERLHLDGYASENALTARVTALAYHGLDLQLHVETPLSPRPVILRLTADQAESRAPRPGDTVTLGWSARDTRVFPA